MRKSTLEKLNLFALAAILIGIFCVVADLSPKWELTSPKPNDQSSPGFWVDSPYVVGGNPYKGQLHAHTTNSDGSLTPTQLATIYRNVGYHFLVITDHDYLTPDPGVPGILHINGVEESAREGHIVAVGPSSQQRGLRPAQDIINGVVAEGGIACLAHPDYQQVDWTESEINSLVNFDLIEVYNGKVNQVSEGMWDYALTNPFLRKVWGVAVDDLHRPNQLDKGYVVVFADSLSVNSILTSLKVGNFYATQGTDMWLSVSGKTITVATSAPSLIEWKKVGGTVIRTDMNKTSSSYTLVGDEVYVRIVITRNSDAKKAWSQPLFIQKE